MKTQHSTQKQSRLFFSIALLFMTILFSSTVYSQTQNERTVKGLVKNDEGPLLGANIILEGTQIGINTDKDGKFTFPKALKTGDILTISYLGYVPQKVRIKENTRFITLTLDEDLVELIGALDSGTPYKSKRRN